MELDNVIKGVGDIGAVGLMFGAYYVLHQSTFKMLQAMLSSMNENFNRALAEQKETVNRVVETFNALSVRQRESEERSYEILRSLAEDVKLVAAGIGRVEMKVDGLERQLNRRAEK